MIMGLIGSIIIGILAGFAAGKIMKNGGFGCLVNLILGVIGGFVGGLLFEALGIQTNGVIGQLITAVVGAVVVLWVAALVKK